jgi:hypothetical protein
VSQAIRGVIGSVDDLPGQIEAALRSKRMSWSRLAAGSAWTRQYLRQAVSAPIVPLEVLEFLTAALNIRPTFCVAPTVSLLLQPSPDPT